MPLANAFLEHADATATESFYPLDVYFCMTCSLVQLLDVVDRESLFRHYLYVTGTSETIAAHNTAYADTIVSTLQLDDSDLVVEVASNDGSLLKSFQPHGVRTLGVEPATNIAELARRDGVETINVFFDRSAAEEIRRSHGPASVVIANNVLAHVDEPRDFLAGCMHLLKDRGLAVIEVPGLGPMLERLEYDTIYHEHLSYFSVTTLVALCESVGMSVRRVDSFEIHGGSLRVYAGLTEHHGPHSPEVLATSAAEEASGLRSLARYERFASDVERNRAALRALLSRLRAEGKSLAGYGAPAKGNTLLNYCGIGTDLVPFTVDRSHLKVGLLTPGMHIPVLPVSALLEKQPDHVLILAWNFAEEIVVQQRELVARGCRFIVPIPEPRVIEG